MPPWWGYQITITCNNMHEAHQAINFWECAKRIINGCTVYYFYEFDLINATEVERLNETKFQITGLHQPMDTTNAGMDELQNVLELFRFHTVDVIFTEKETSTYGYCHFYKVNNTIQFHIQFKSFYGLIKDYIKSTLVYPSARRNAIFDRNHQNHQAHQMQQAVEESGTGKILKQGDKHLAPIITNFLFIPVIIPTLQDITNDQVERFIAQMTWNQYVQSIQDCLELSGFDDKFIELYLMSG